MKSYFSLLTLIALLGYSKLVSGQVGIGTVNPAVGTILHIEDHSGVRGVKLPEADIEDLNTVDPLPTGTEEGTMVYNINPFTGMGHFYWNGFVWAPIQLFAYRSAKFNHIGPIETNNDVDLNKPASTGGVDVELMDNVVFNETSAMFTIVPDSNGRSNRIQILMDGRYRITVFVGLEQDGSGASTGSTAIQGRLKITDATNVVRYEGSYHRSTEMDRTGLGDDDGTLYFTEIIELRTGDLVAVNCTGLEGTSAVYQRDPNLSAFIIEKLR